MALAIYSTATGRLRRIIRNSPGESASDLSLEVNHLAFTGETRIRISDGLTIDQTEAAVLVDSGIVPANDRYVLVTVFGNVTGAITADPLTGDSIPNRTLVQHETAREGWRQMLDSTFQRSLSEIDSNITGNQGRIDLINSPAWLTTQVDKGLALGQALADRAQENRVLNARANELAIERSARLQPR